MYLVDTNVVSEARRGSREAHDWLSGIGPDSIFLSVITLGEIERGIVKLAKRDPIGASKLAEWKFSLLSMHANRILPVTSDIAMEWGRLQVGRTVGVADALMTATAFVHGLALVTRNVKDFEFTGVRLVNPWQ